MTKEEILYLIKDEPLDALMKKAYELKALHRGKKVYFRGLIEVSNLCVKNCYYCGLRKDNLGIDRYIMSKESVLQSAIWSYRQNYASIVLQAGERSDPSFVGYIEDLLLSIHKATDNKLRITLSLGEQTSETYKRWYNAGATRYLLRIETSNKNLYEKLHPKDHSFDQRVEALKLIKKVGFKLGSGVMIGLPYQTISDLADDLIFLKNIGIGMCGMGPFLTHPDTPLHNLKVPSIEQRVELTLRMIAILRIMMPTINIAATTAMQALHPQGREMALQAGANVMMPQTTDTTYRPHYNLYPNRPFNHDDSIDCKNSLEKKIASIGETIGYDEWGDD